VPLPEIHVSVHLAPAAAALGGVSHQALDLVYGGTDLGHGLMLQLVRRVSWHPVEQAGECGVDRAAELLEALAGGAPVGAVEPEAVLSQVPGRLLCFLLDVERRSAELGVGDVGLAQIVGVGQLLSDRPLVDCWQTCQEVLPGAGKVVVLGLRTSRGAGWKQGTGSFPHTLQLVAVRRGPVHCAQQLL